MNKKYIFSLILALVSFLPNISYAQSTAALSTTVNGNEAGPVSIQYTVTLNSTNITGSALSFNIDPSGGTATAGSDYTNFAGSTVSVANGASTGTFSVVVTDDSLLETTETVQATISNPPVGISITTANATANITDNDTATAALSTTTNGNEAGPVNIVYTVTLSKTNNTGSAINFNLNSTGGTATSGSDYTSFTGSTISVANGASTGTFSVTVTDDALLEAVNETVTGTISSPSIPAVTISTANATANIADNDTATVDLSVTTHGVEGGTNIVYTATLSKTNNSGAAITVNISPTGGTATSGSDYTAFTGTTISIANGASTGTRTVTVTNDTLLESTESVIATISTPSLASVTIGVASATANITDNETATVALSVVTNGNETGPVSIVYRATLSRANNTGSAITFDINPTAGTATAGSDYTDFTATTISIANGATTGDKTVVVVNDTLFENTETATATISNSSFPAVTIATASAAANITDNDNGAGSITANLTATTNGDEAGPISAVYTVTLSKTNNTSGNINFTINPSGGTATAGSDYTNFASATLSVPPGSSTGTYSVTITDDALFENNETIAATVSSPSDPAIALGTSSATLSLIDNDNINVDASISVATNGNEAGQVAIDYTVTLAKTNNTGADITIDVDPTGGTATASLDYTTFAGTTLTIPNGDSSVSFSVPVRDDSLFENNETVIATISNASDPAIVFGTPSIAGTILDNDNTAASIGATLIVTPVADETGGSAFTYTVSIAKTNYTGSSITFDLNPGGSATAGSDFTDYTGTVLTIPNGSSLATLTVNAVDDTLFENNETVIGTISNPSDPAINITTATANTTIIDNDNVNASINATLSAFASGDEAGPTPITFRVTLAKANNTGAPITFQIQNTGGSANAGTDYTNFHGSTISVPSGSDTGDLNVAVSDDLLFESNETVSALILNQSDPAIRITSPRATATLNDNDNLPGTVDANLSVTTNGSETGPTNIVYTVTISKTNFTGGNVSFNIAHTGGTTISGTDFTAYGTSTISIGNGSNTGTFSVDVTNDTLFESTETAIATISSPSHVALNIVTASASANITDNDSPVTANLSVERDGDENGPVSIIYTVTLNKTNNTGSTITFNINPTGGTATAGTDYTNFTGGTISIPNGRPFGTLTVPVVNDGDIEGAETVTATISSPSNANVTIGTANATANIADDDVIPPTLNASLSMLTEGDETGPQALIYTVFLSAKNTTGSAITFDIDPTGGTAIAGTDYTDFSGLTISVANNATTGTISIPITNDTLWENDETVIATISNPSSGIVTIIDDSATGTIFDDDNGQGTIPVTLSVIQHGSETGPVNIIYQLVSSKVNNTGSPVTFSFNPNGGSASAGADYTNFAGATLSIPNGSDTATYTVTVLEDLFFENTHTVVGRISNPSDAAINLSTSIVQVTANITDNDNPVGGIPANLSVTQHGSETGPTNIIYTVTIAETNYTSSNIGFTLTRTAGSSIAGSDYIVLASNSISVPVGSNTGTFTVQVTEDTAFENTETLEMTLSAASDPAININTAVATGNITDNDNATTSINASLTSSRVGTEAGPTNLVYTISIPTTNYSVNGDLTFTINPTGGTATAGSDYTTFAGGTITIPYGKPFGNLNVTVLDDTLFENTETVLATVSSPSDPAINLTTANATGQITDNDNATNSISAALSVDTNGNEAGSVGIVYKVTLSKANDTSSPITFTLNPIGGTATAGSDYTNFASSTISVPPGSNVGTYTVNVTDDGLFENNETVQARISTSSDPAVFISTNSATATIVDNDNAPTSVNADLSVTTNGNETGPVDIVYTVTLANANNTGAPITFTINPTGGSATTTSDYTNFAGATVTIANGSSTGTYSVPVVNDALFENTETVQATISSASDPAININTASATANIIDSDNSAASISAVLSQQTSGSETGPTSIVYRVTLGTTNNTHGAITFAINPTGGTATLVSDYTDFSGSTITVADGASTGTFSVPVVDDTLFENNETVQATISSASDPAINITTANASGTIVDNDNTANSINADITVTQNGNETGPVDISYQLTIAKVNNTQSAITFNLAASGTATNGSDYATFPATLSIPVGSDTATFTRTVTDDTLFENTETAIATISSPSDAAIKLNTPAATATITDNDNGAATVTADLSVQTNGNETGPTSIVYRVTLSKTNNTHGNVSFTINPTGGSATAVSDYANFASATISVPDGASTGTYTVTVVNDTLFENTETVQATISSPTDPATTINTASATANITDNDNGAGTVNTVLSATTNGREAGPVSIVYTATLSKTNNTHGPITLAINPTGGTATIVTEYTDFTGSTITIADGASTGTLTVPVFDDTLFENNETVIATISSPSDPALGLTTPSATAQLIDDDNTANSINADLSLISGGNETGPVNIQVQVTLAKVNNTHGTITVNLAQTAGTTTSGSDYTIGGTVSIADGSSTGTATLTVIDDTLFENNESTTLSISSPSDPALHINTASVVTGIVDNDNGAGSVVANLSTTTNGNEAGPVSIVYTVTLAKANNTHTPITFNINPTAGTAIAGTDYTNFTAGTISVADGSSTGTLSVAVVNDTLFENNETVTATIDTPSDPAVAIGTASSAATIIDNDNGAGTVNAALSVTTHGNETGPVSIVYTATLAKTNNTGAAITFNVNPTAGTASAGADYTDFTGSTITVANGASTGTITVPVVNDTLFENTETLTATISSASDPAIGIGTPSATANITDNDNAAASITANIGTLNDGNETGPVNITVPVTISKINNTHSAISFTLAQFSGTATSGVDYTFSGTVSIPDGSDTGNATLTVVNDAAFENNETLTMRISSPSDPAITIGTSDDSAIIFDNDNTLVDANLSVTTQGNETGPVSIVYTVTLASANNTGSAITFDINPTAGTAIAGADYTDFTGGTVTIANGSSTGTLTVPVLNDTLFENTETVTATISNVSDPGVNINTASATANIIDSDNAAASINANLSVTTHGNETGPVSIVYTVTLAKTNNTGSAISFDIDPTSVSATAGTDYNDFTGSSISVANGSSTGTLTVTVSDDALFENNETAIATISNVSDPAININTASATANITDNDNAAASINANLSVTTNGNETGPVSIVYTLTLASTNNTHSPITFDIDPTGGSATSGSDYTNYTGSTISVADGSNTGTLTVAVTNDALFENTETAIATISNESDPAININIASATANITDNDNAAGSINADLSVTTHGNETGPVSIVYTVTLASTNNTHSPITFDINPTGGTATAGSDYTNFSGSTISVANGSNSGSITVVVTNDTLFENTETAIATISNASDSAININTSSATANITDNDNAAASIDADLSVTTHGNETGPVSIVYTVTLAKTNNTGSSINFDIDPTAGTATATNDYTDFTGATISVPNGSATGTYSVTVVNDTLFENTETVTATISNASDPAININTDSSSANIIDSDNAPGSIDADLTVTTNGDEVGPVDIVYTLTIANTNNTGSPITFNIDPVGGTATAGNDYTTFAGSSITIANGSNTGTITVPVLDDIFYEITETVIAEISNPSDPAINLNTPTASADISSDELALNAELSVTTHGSETGPVNIVYTVNLDNTNYTGSDITIDIDPTGGTSTAGSDFVDFSGTTITIPNGSDTGTKTISVIDDSLFENNETLTATLSNPSDAGIILVVDSATANITDNDNTAGSINAILSATTSGNETGPVSIVYTVTLAKTNNTHSALSFDINPTAGTATVVNDYVDFTAGTISVADGSATGTFSVTVVDDTLFENNETAVATISNPSDPAIAIATASATGTIIDNDNINVLADIGLLNIGNETGPVNITVPVTLSNINNTHSTISFSLAQTSGLATSGSDYTLTGTVSIPDGSDTGTATLTVINDNLFENNESLTMTISAATDPAIVINTPSASTSIIDNDNTAGSINANLAVTRHGNETGPVSIVYTVTLGTVNNTGAPITFAVNPSGGTATTGADYTDFTSGTITIANGASTGTLTVPVVNDTLFENTETVSATISAASDPAIAIGTSSATANITDNDNAAGSINAALSVTTQGSETGPVNIIYTVNIGAVNNTGAPITFTINPSGGTATAGADYSDFTGATITILPGESSGSLTVTILTDSLFENTETLSATISGASDPAISIGTATTTANITDSFTAGSINANISATTNGHETGPVNIVYTVTIDTVNNTGSSINFAINPTGGTAIAPSDYTDFTGATVSIPDGSSTATFTVTVIDDAEIEITESVIATLSGASNAAITINTASATATITDNEVEIIESPFYTIWNSFLDQVNIEALANKGNVPVNITATILDINGNTLGQQSIVLQPKQEFDLIVNDIPGYPLDTYGIVRIDFDQPNSLEGHAAIYRLPRNSTGFDENNKIEYSIFKPLVNTTRGDTFATFNTIQPSTNPSERNNLISHWVQVANAENARQNFTLKKYDINGNEIQSLRFSVPAQGRRDIEGGHVVPGANNVGLIRIIPDLPNTKYLAQVFQYSHNDLAGIEARSYSFALGETMRNGTTSKQYLNISRGAGAINWITVANVGSSNEVANLRLIDNDGTQLLNTNVNLSAFAQQHFLASDYLPTGHSGVAIITSSGANNVVSNTRSYYYERNGSVAEASMLEGRHLLSVNTNSIANTFLNQSNWLRIFNVSNSPVNYTVESYDLNGNLQSSRALSLGAEKGIDLEAEFHLGLNIPDNSYGVLRLVPERPGAIFAETRRIKTFNNVIDLSQPIPFR